MSARHDSALVTDAAAGGAPAGLFGSSPLEQAMGTYLPATVAFRLINFGRILLLSWTMLQQQFGLLNMILLVVNVMTPLCSFGLNEAITRYVPQNEARGSLAAFLRRSAVLLLGITAACLVPILIFAQPLGGFFYAQVFADPAVRGAFSADAPSLARISAVVIALLIVYFYLLATLKGLRMFSALSVMEIMHGGLFLVLSVVAIALGRLSALTLTVFYGCSLVVPIVFIGWGLRRAIAGWAVQQRTVETGRVLRALLKFGVWTTVAGVTWQILVYYPAWFLNKVHGNEAVAVFSAVRQIGQFILIGAVAVVAVVMSNVTKTWETRGSAAANRQLSLAFRGCGLALLFGCVAAALGRDLIIRMFRSDYAAGAAILPLQLLFFLLAAYLAFLAIHFQLIEKTRQLFWPWATGVAANVLLALWLTGPKLETVQLTGLWRALAPWSDRVFITGFSGPQGLDGAAWCGVLAIACALLMCLVLLRAEHRHLDRGSYILILAAGLLACRPWMLALGAVVLLAATFRTGLLFSADERRRLFTYAADAFRHIPVIRSRGGRRR